MREELLKIGTLATVIWNKPYAEGEIIAPAEEIMIAANAQIGVAKAPFFPQLIPHWIGRA